MTLAELQEALVPITEGIQLQTQVISGLFIFLGIIFGLLFISLFFKRF